MISRPLLPLFFCLAPVLPGGYLSSVALAADLPPATVATMRPGDKYILPSGAGTKDGSSWQNALDGQALQRTWDALGAGNTLWVGSGRYTNGRLTIGSGGEPGKLKTLAGKDTGSGLPVFAGTFQKENAAQGGAVFISTANGADYWSVQDIQVENYGIGLASRDGGHTGVRIRNLDVTGSREGMSLSGGGTHQTPDAASNDWEIRDCDFRNFTKRGIRFKNGNYNMQVINCLADAGGREWATEPFHMGFSLEGAGAHTEATAGANERDITFLNCVAQNAYDESRRYWNGDGFCAERNIKNLTFINCLAFNNTDGGWDLKAENVRLENCVAIGNKKNYRFWGQSTTLVNCLSAFSVWPGGSAGHAGLWTNGVVNVDRSTFLDSAITPDTGSKITVTNSIIARTRAQVSTAPLGEVPGLTLKNTLIYDEASGQGEDPGFKAPTPAWDGRGTAFDAARAGERGYKNVPVPLPAFVRTLPVPGTPAKPGKPAATAAGTPVPAIPFVPGGEGSKPQLQNGSFEEELAGWAKARGPVWQIKTGEAAEGQKYATVTTENRAEAQLMLGGLVAGGKYTLTFHSRGNTSTDARVIVRGGPGNEYLARGVPAKGETWTAQTLKFTAPATEVALQISLRSAGTVDLDNFVVQRTG